MNRRSGDQGLLAPVFEEFIADLRPSLHERRTLFAQAQFALRVLQNDTDFGIVEILPSGSLEKGTALAGHADVDCVLHMHPDACVSTQGDRLLPSTILGRLTARISKMYGGRIEVVMNNRSASLLFADGPKCDIVPGVWDGNADYEIEVPDRAARRWVYSCIPDHVEFTRSRGEVLQDAVRLSKLWRHDWTIRRFGFALELLMCKAFDLSAEPISPIDVFTSMIESIVESELQQPVCFDDFYDLREVDVEERPVTIVDPVNPTNNVSEDLEESDRLAILNKAGETLHWIDRGAQCLDRDDVQMACRWWSNVFPGFEDYSC